MAQLANYADVGLLAQLLAPLTTAFHARDGRADGALHALRKRLTAKQILCWPMTAATLNHLAQQAAQRRAERHAAETVAAQALHGVPPCRAVAAIPRRWDGRCRRKRRAGPIAMPVTPSLTMLIRIASIPTTMRRN